MLLTIGSRNTPVLSFISVLPLQVLCQEGVVSELESEVGRLKREAESASSRLQAAEANEQDMAAEYAALKSNFLAMSEGLEREITHSQELSEELLTLAHTHDTLLHEKEQEHTRTLELERVRALLSKVSHSIVRVSHTHKDLMNALQINLTLTLTLVKLIY